MLTSLHPDKYIHKQNPQSLLEHHLNAINTVVLPLAFSAFAAATPLYISQ